MTVVEQRYRAVLAVSLGEPKTDAAAQFGVSRQRVPESDRPRGRCLCPSLTCALPCVASSLRTPSLGSAAIRASLSETP